MLREIQQRTGSTEFKVYQGISSLTSANDAAYLDLTIDSLPFSSIALTLSCTLNAVTLKAYGATLEDFSDQSLVATYLLEVGTPQTDIWITPPFRFYRFSVESTAAGSHGVVSLDAILGWKTQHAVYWDDALVNIATLTQGNTPADPIDFGPSGTRPKIYGFGIGEDMDGSLQFSHRYKEGTDIEFHIHWAPVAATGGNVKWELSYYWLNIGEAAVGGPTILTAESAAGTTAWTQKLTGFPTIVGTGKRISSIIVFKIKRVAASASDLSGDVAGLSVDAHFQIDSPGSRQELVK